MSEPVHRVLSSIRESTVIASGPGVHRAGQMRNLYDGSKWRKMKGVARVESANGLIGTAEIHWFEAHGVGRRRMKVKRWIALE